MVRFSTNILIKKSSIELFGITQANDESTQAYLKMFDEKILKVKELLKHVAFESLISGVTGRALWKKLYALPNKSLLKVKQAMEN